MRKVMVIEDDRSMLDLLTALLELEGFQVKTIESTTHLEEVYGQVLAEQPDLILCDVHLGQWSGFDLLNRLKNAGDASPHGAGCSSKVLMSSGMEMQKESRLRGADGFIMKPYMPDELVFKIKHILGT